MTMTMMMMMMMMMVMMVITMMMMMGFDDDDHANIAPTLESCVFPCLYPRCMFLFPFLYSHFGIPIFVSLVLALAQVCAFYIPMVELPLLYSLFCIPCGGQPLHRLSFVVCNPLRRFPLTRLTLNNLQAFSRCLHLETVPNIAYSKARNNVKLRVSVQTPY